jgi:hypothetical protein
MIKRRARLTGEKRAAAFEKGRAWDAKHVESVRTSAYGAAVTIFDCSL